MSRGWRHCIGSRPTWLSGIHVVTVLVIIVVSVSLAAAEEPSPHTLFVISSGHSALRQGFALSAAWLATDASRTATMLVYEADVKDIIPPERATVQFIPARDADQRVAVNDFSERDFWNGGVALGIYLLTNYDVEHDAAENAIRALAKPGAGPDARLAVVCDVFNLGCSDFCVIHRDELNLECVIHYHPGVFGIFGVGDEPGMPDVATGQSKDESGFLDRLYHLYVMGRFLTSMSPALDTINEARARRGYSTPMDPFERVQDGNLILAATFFGLDLARPLPPTIHTLGLLHTKPWVSRKSLPSSDHKREAQAVGTFLAQATAESQEASGGDGGGGAPLVLAAFGTEALPRRALVEAIVEGVTQGTNARLLLALRGSARAEVPHVEQLCQLPACLVVQWVDQEAVLSVADVFITHGGAASLGEGLAAGVPMVVVPAGADRFALAQRLQEAGGGERVDTDTVTAEDIGRIVGRMLQPHASERAAVQRLHRLSEACGGVERGAKLLEDARVLGARHLKPHLSSFVTRFDVDILAAVLVVMFAIVYTCTRFACCLLRCCGCCGRKKLKKHKKRTTEDKNGGRSSRKKHQKKA